MKRSLILVLLLLLPAGALAAVAPSNRMVLRDPTTNAKVVLGSVRFYAAGKDSTSPENQVDFTLDATTSTWDNEALTVSGDSIRAGFYNGYWRHSLTRILVAREWLNGAKARAASVDWSALAAEVQDAIQAGGNGGGSGTLTKVGVYESTGMFVTDSTGTPMLGIADGGIGARQLAPGCLPPVKLDGTGGDTGDTDDVYCRDANGDGYWYERSLLGGGGGGGGGDVTGIGVTNGLMVAPDSLGGKLLIGLNVDLNEAVGGDSALVVTGNPKRLHIRKMAASGGGGGSVTNPLTLGSSSEAGQVKLHSAVSGNDHVITIAPSDGNDGDEGDYTFPVPTNQPVAGRVLVCNGSTASRWRTYLSLEGSGSFAGGASLGDDQLDPVDVYGTMSLHGNTATVTISNGTDSTGVNLAWVTKSMRAYAWWTGSANGNPTPAPPSQTVYAVTRDGRVTVRASGAVTGNREATYMVFTP